MNVQEVAQAQTLDKIALPARPIQIELPTTGVTVVRRDLTNSELNQNVGSIKFAELYDKFVRWAHQQYIGDVRYHASPEHPLEVEQAAMAIADRCEKGGLTIDRAALRLAAWGHDVLFALNPRSLNFESSEQLAADYVKAKLIEFGAAPAFAEKVQNIIKATHFAVVPKTAEEMIIRAADLGNIGGEFEGFRAKSVLLHREAQSIGGSKLTYEEWVPKAMSFVSLYVWPMLQLTPAAVDEAGRSRWHKNALGNIAQLLRSAETKTTAPLTVVGFIGGETSAAIQAHKPAANELAIGFEPEQTTRKARLDATRKMTWDGVAAPVVLYAPGTTTAIPLEDSTLDKLVITLDTTKGAFLNDLREGARVVRKGGVLEIEVQGLRAPDLRAQVIALHEMGFPVYKGWHEGSAQRFTVTNDKKK